MATRSEISKKAWRARKRKGGKATCNYCKKPIYAGGALCRGTPYHKTCAALMLAGFAPGQVLNPKKGQRARTAWRYYGLAELLNPLVEVDECPKCHRKRGERHLAVTKRPSIRTMERWMDEGIARATDGCRVEPDGTCPHGHKSWILRLGYVNPLRTSNPRPPAGWWARMYPGVVAEYPGLGKQRHAQITAGIFYNYPKQVRERIIREYE